MIRLISSLILSLFIAAPALAATQQEEHFMTITGSDLGRPYKVLDGICLFQMNPKLLNLGAGGPIANMLNSSLQAGVKQLQKIGQKAGADALVHMTITPMLVPNSVNATDLLTDGGVYICGDLVQSTTTGREASLK